MVTLENSAAKMKVSGGILIQILQHPGKKVRTCLNVEKKKSSCRDSDIEMVSS